MGTHRKRDQAVSQLVDLSDHQQVLEEVQIITRLILPSFDFQYVISVFEDVETPV